MAGGMAPRMTPGTPATKERGGTIVPSSTTHPAATSDSSPISQSSSTIAPIPMRQRSRIVAPWRIARWPAVTSLPTVSPERPPVTWRMQPSWMFVRAPTRIGPTSPRRTDPYHTDDSSPKMTSPTTTAVGAMKADAGTTGARPRSGAITAAMGGSRRLEIFGIPLPEVLGVHLLEVAAQLLRLLLGGLLGGRRRTGLARRLLEDLVHDEDRDPRAERDRDRIAGPGIDRDRARAPIQVDVGEEGRVLEVGDHHARDLPFQGFDDVDQEIVRERPLIPFPHQLHVNRGRLVRSDPDGEHPRAFNLLKYDHRAFRSLVDGETAHPNGDHAHGGYFVPPGPALPESGPADVPPSPPESSSFKSGPGNPMFSIIHFADPASSESGWTRRNSSNSLRARSYSPISSAYVKPIMNCAWIETFSSG